MKLNIKKAGLLLGLISAIGFQVKAQSGSGSTSVSLGLEIVFGTRQEEFAEKAYYGPGIYKINGTLDIYSKAVWISPSALFVGSGTIVIHDPGDNPFYTTMPSAPTLLDGNNCSPIEVNIELRNNKNLVLTDLADPGFTQALPVGNLAAALHIGNDFKFAVDNGDVILNGNDFILSPYATISNYGPAKMVVTGNSISGHLVREASTGTFTYPVGIAEGDYTPATITPATPQQIQVSVTDYNASGTIIDAPQEGMNRAWHIYAGTAVNATINLQHNMPTNGTAYTDNMAFITQYQGAGVWSSQPVSGYLSAGLHTLNAIPVSGNAAANGSWLTKTSDPITPLPVKLLSFDGLAKDCKTWLTWQSAEEQNFSRYEIERSGNGATFTKIGAVQAIGSNSSYSYTDRSPSNGNNIYRLKLIDSDAAAVYSDYLTVQVSCRYGDITLYPNPSDGIVTIKGLQGNEHLQLFDATGRLLQLPKAVAGLLQLDLTSYSGGMYRLIVISNGTVTHTFKISKTK